MSDTFENILIGVAITISLAIAAFLYLGAGAVLGNLFGFEGFTWYFTMVAWPMLIMILLFGLAVSLGIIRAVVRIFK